MTRLAFAALAVLAITATPSEAREYNQSGGISSDTQAMINRIRADMAVEGKDQGEFGSFEDDCGELDVGVNEAGASPDNQVIIADSIVNIGGRCRIVRRSGGFRSDPAGQTPSTLNTPSDIDFE